MSEDQKFKIYHHTCSECGKPLKAYSIILGDIQLASFCPLHFKKKNQQYIKATGKSLSVISQSWQGGKRAKRTRDERVKRGRRR